MVLLASGELRPRGVLSILQYGGKPPATKNVYVK